MLLLLLACTQPGGAPLGQGGDDTDSGTPVEVLPGDTATAWVACEGATPVRLNELVAANHHGATDVDGDTSDWIELALPADATAPVDLLGWALSDDGEVDPEEAFPARTLAPGAPLLVFASGKDRLGDTEPHAAFKLDALGDHVFLHMPDGCVADEVDAGRLYGDVSLGRASTGAWEYFLEPTPGAPNTTESRPGFADPPLLSPAPGFYAEPVAVTLTGARVTYTLDGSLPDDTSAPYAGALALDAEGQPVVVRARAYVDGLWPSRVATGTYSEDPAILAGVRVISLTVDPPDLWDETTGIYVPGPGAEPGYPYFGANFWQVWEKDLHVEVFDRDGTAMVAQDAGIQIAGGYSRAFDQRNFELLARTGYGPDAFDAPLFDDEDIGAFQRLYLRNGGDWCGTQLVDGTVQALFRDPEGRRYAAVDAQAYEPVLVYLNGAFWGLYELKERLDEGYIAAHHGEDPDALDRVKLGWTHDANWTLDQGDWTAFEALEALVATRDLSDPDAYAAFAAQVDVDNFISATVAQGWIGNTDWWSNNLRMWRPRHADDGGPDDGRWRWMVYDFGHGWPSWSYDHLATSVGGNWRGLPIAAALANDTFRDRFVNVHADYLNTTLAPRAAVATVQALADEIRPVFGRQQARWCGGENLPYWESGIAYAETFAANRPAAIDQGLLTHLGLAGHATLTLDAEPAGAGRFHLAVVDVDAPFSGVYYEGVPVEVTAVPNPGWVFEGWDGALGADGTITLPMAGDTAVVGRFRGE